MSTNTNSGGLLAVVLLALGVLVLVPLFGMGTGMMGSGHMGPGQMGGGWWGAGAGSGWFLVAVVMRLAFLAVVVAGVYLVYRALSDPAEQTDPALEQLRVAYARGDLSEEEFERRRERLQRDS